MRFVISGVLIVVIALPCAAQAPFREKTPVLFDTDLGSDLGDGFALALMLASPEIDLRGVTTVSGDTQVRALMACRFLTMTGRRHTAVAAGEEPQLKSEIAANGLYRYYYHPDVLFNRTTRPVKESAVDFLYSRLKAQQGKITLIAGGPLTNIARLVAEKPDCKPWIRQIVFVRGKSHLADEKATQAVLQAGIPMVVVPPELTTDLSLDQASLKRIFAPVTALSLQIQAMHQLWQQDAFSLEDVLAAALCVDETFCTWKEAEKVKTAVSIDRSRFLNWLVNRLENCVSPADRPAKLVAQGGMPNRVHVAEDYELDIERFWWMSGIPETKNLPAGSTRACRGSLTHDFDDLLGHTKAMYTAVIFNPVPGPPMGKNARLSFRYWLKGTDKLRVQIYSLSNGHHRQLYLHNLPQGSWQSGTVDMTVARRPDGTGGPLSETERIDDIQFYTDPTAELLIDDVVLFDAATPDEKRPFPKHIHYTATYDSGTREKHWPGDLEIVPDKGFFWRAARSVANADTGTPWLRLNLRGERPMSDVTHLSFRHHLTGADNMRVLLRNRTQKTDHVVELKNLKTDEWAQSTVDFSTAKPGGPRRGDRVDEIHFLLPERAELLLDDVLLYEPDLSAK